MTFKRFKAYSGRNIWIVTGEEVGGGSRDNSHVCSPIGNRAQGSEASDARLSDRLTADQSATDGRCLLTATIGKR